MKVIFDLLDLDLDSKSVTDLIESGSETLVKRQNCNKGERKKGERKKGKKARKG
jgi:hypothetical protein